ncbi:MAG: endonuclease III [Erysipelotrichales bacterium]|nr:MAG: endonuclease III [Erysipelotrichales bacterium]
METVEALDIIEAMFPDAQCELDYATTFQLAVSVILSAQTTDKAVNDVTPGLFKQFPDPKAMAAATQEQIENLIRRIGLYHNKAKHILAFAQELEKVYHGEVPSSMKELISLPGIGSKTANVIQAVGFAIPALAVDTHVDRVSHRLGWVRKDADVSETERTLKRKIPQERWIKAHHAILFFGRYHCKAQKPDCAVCPLKDVCHYHIEKSRNLE